MKRLLLLLLALGLSSCQYSAPLVFEPPPPISTDVLARFALDGPAPEPIYVLGESKAADASDVDGPLASIELADVMASVEQHFPLVLAAREEIEISEGRLDQARGGFDTRLSGRGKSDFENFYESNRLDLGLEQPTRLWGSTFSGGYRIGRGDFAIYDGEEKTNEGGELRLGVRLPLLQNRAIDPRRVAEWNARLAREQADPVILRERLEATVDAARAYWRWVAAGRLREVSLQLLALAEDRMAQVDLAVEEGLLAPINLTENQRLIVDRRSSLLSAERSLQEAAISLSLYWRDAEGRPAVPTDAMLPFEFPAPRPAGDVLVPGDEEFALEQRPELRAIQLDVRSLEIDQQLARNTLLPRLDVGLAASQDVGASVNDPDDKEDLELEAFLALDVPLQRNRARGKVRELEAKIARLEHQARFLSDSIVADVQDARSALMQSWLRIGEARMNVRLANELADAERFQLQAGESDLLRVNLREQQAAVSAAIYIDVLQEYFQALAGYRAVLGIPYGVSTASVTFLRPGADGEK